MSASPACREILGNIQGYLDGDLDRTACTTIERHCQDCPDCAAIVKGLKETIGLCREAGSAPLPDAVRERAREGIRRLLGGEPNRQ